MKKLLARYYKWLKYLKENNICGQIVTSEYLKIDSWVLISLILMRFMQDCRQIVTASGTVQLLWVGKPIWRCRELGSGFAVPSCTASGKTLKLCACVPPFLKLRKSSKWFPKVICRVNSNEEIAKNLCRRLERNIPNVGEEHGDQLIMQRQMPPSQLFCCLPWQQDSWCRVLHEQLSFYQMRRYLRNVNTW